MNEIDNIKISIIPFASELLKGDWYGIVYAIKTESNSLEEHYNRVNEFARTKKREYADDNKYTSLREVKRELVVNNGHHDTYCTLIQFRVRDSY